MDTRTLLQVLLVIQAASALALWFNWRQYPTIEGTGWWAVGAVGSLVGLGLIVLRQIIPDLLSVVASNLVLAGAHAAVLTGHHRFAGTRPPIAAIAVLLVGLAAALIWHTYVDPSVAARIVATTVVTAASCALLLRALWPLLRVEGYRIVILLIAVTTAYLVLSLWRAAATVHAEPALSGLFSLSLIQPAFYYVLIAYCVGTMYGITLLTTERRERDLEDVAGLDALTGVLNRRLFEQRAVGEIAAAERHGRPLCLLLLDIDRLDAINDRHGRAAGDQVLRRLAGVGHAHLRVSDAFARFDDDEFAVLLVDTDVGAAQLVAERMRSAFAAAPAHPAPATLSVGLARLAPDMHDLATLMRAAEAALYAAKTAGRNQVAWAEDPPRIVPA